jgi:hypothetical protein
MHMLNRKQTFKFFYNAPLWQRFNGRDVFTCGDAEEQHRVSLRLWAGAIAGGRALSADGRDSARRRLQACVAMYPADVALAASAARAMVRMAVGRSAGEYRSAVAMVRRALGLLASSQVRRFALFPVHRFVYRLSAFVGFAAVISNSGKCISGSETFILQRLQRMSTSTSNFFTTTP